MYLDNVWQFGDGSVAAPEHPPTNMNPLPPIKIGGEYDPYGGVDQCEPNKVCCIIPERPPQFL